MSQNIVYVGIDVDDVRYHGCALHQRAGAVLDFHWRPTLRGLVGQSEKLREYFGAVRLKLCHEASHVGFSPQRDLIACCWPADTRTSRRWLALGKSWGLSGNR